jgi:hypothetical protein
MDTDDVLGLRRVTIDQGSISARPPTIRGSQTDDRPFSDALRRLLEPIPLKSLVFRIFERQNA